MITSTVSEDLQQELLKEIAKENWYPKVVTPRNKKLICYCCDGWGTKNDARTELKRMGLACRGIDRIKQSKATI